ncbi:MAG: hypothetical protein JST89_13870 [Cyanobacteria bacterium SZAS-4]|nr:hypothetical protein [Cyanobacteria bacterium SZAS-4]
MCTSFSRADLDDVVVNLFDDRPVVGKAVAVIAKEVVHEFCPIGKGCHPIMAGLLR